MDSSKTDNSDLNLKKMTSGIFRSNLEMRASISALHSIWSEPSKLSINTSQFLIDGGKKKDSKETL